MSLLARIAEGYGLRRRKPLDIQALRNSIRSDIEVRVKKDYANAMSNAGERDFNKDAATWDLNPSRLKLAEDVCQAIVQQVCPQVDWDVLDFGCGTGLLTLRLRPRVRFVTGADSSPGMLEVLKQKVAAQGLRGVATMHLDVEQGATLTGEYDLVTSSMTLHHVQHIEPLLAQFFQILRPGGVCALADLDPEGGLFHENNAGVHHFGFEREQLRKLFTAAGFREVRDRTAAEITKPAADGQMRRFTVFLISGQKPA